MMKTAKVSTWIALALLPVAVLLLGRHFRLVFLAGMAAVPVVPGVAGPATAAAGDRHPAPITNHSRIPVARRPRGRIA